MEFRNSKIIYLGKSGNYPDENIRKQITNNFQENDKWVVHLISHEVTLQYSEHIGPACFVVGIVALGDPNVGIIHPQEFYDPWIFQREVELFKQSA